MDELAVHIGLAPVGAAVAKRQFFLIKAEPVQHGGVEVASARLRHGADQQAREVFSLKPSPSPTQ